MPHKKQQHLPPCGFNIATRLGSQIHYHATSFHTIDMLLRDVPTLEVAYLEEHPMTCLGNFDNLV